MHLKDFNYSIPEHLIAQHPLGRRDQARLLVVNRAEKTIEHNIFANIGKYLPPNSCIVVNDSKVVPARLLGKREGTGGEVEVFLLKKIGRHSYETLLRPLRRLKKDDKIIFHGNGLTARVKNRENRIVEFNKKDLTPYLNRFGHMPLPPYIRRNDTRKDRKDYQTIFAKETGSVASPTAGLHFTNSLLRKLGKQGHTFTKVTLHINYATFKPVEEKDITQHKMHSEDYTVSLNTFRTVKTAKQDKRKIVAVGTTSCRVLETVAPRGNLVGSTDLFIYPGYKFIMTDVLITNFHQPHSTLLMLVYAFGGKKLMQEAYNQAIKNKYRFFSYGDAMLIL